MSIIMPDLEDIFDIAHNEGYKEACEAILKMVEEGCDLSYIRSFLLVERDVRKLPALEKTLRNTQKKEDV